MQIEDGLEVSARAGTYFGTISEDHFRLGSERPELGKAILQGPLQVEAGDVPNDEEILGVVDYRETTEVRPVGHAKAGVSHRRPRGGDARLTTELHRCSQQWTVSAARQQSVGTEHRGRG